jgi:hypothetical protein
MQHPLNTNLPLPPLHNHIPHYQPPPPPHNNILHHQPLSPLRNQFFQPPPPPLPHLGTTDPKIPLANHLQLAPWPSHYWATPSPKYHSNTYSWKFLICYEAAIALAEGGKATLTKSLIISLEDAAANWYSRLLPRCIYSWQQLKEKFLLNFQEFQAELDTEIDFLSCAQWEKETLPYF